MALGRPLFTVTAFQNEYPLSIFATSAPGTMVFSFALNKNFLPKHDITGKLGVRISAKINHPNLGMHTYVRIGGTQTGADGIASPEGLMTLQGLNSTGRLEVDISSLYSGRDTEWCKLFTYADSGGSGGLPNIDTQTIIISGDEPPQRPPLIVVPSTAPNEVGVDIDCITDITPQFKLAYGLRNLANALLRRLITPRGGLFYDPDYGLDLRDYLNAGLTDGQIVNLAGAVGLELEKDERVSSAEVAMTFTPSSMTLRLRCKVEVVDVGQMSLLLEIGQVTAAVLDASLVT